jgi:hypothetical protein
MDALTAFSGLAIDDDKGKIRPWIITGAKRLVLTEPFERPRLFAKGTGPKSVLIRRGACWFGSFTLDVPIAAAGGNAFTRVRGIGPAAELAAAPQAIAGPGSMWMTFSGFRRGVAVRRRERSYGGKGLVVDDDGIVRSRVKSVQLVYRFLTALESSSLIDDRFRSIGRFGRLIV